MLAIYRRRDPSRDRPARYNSAAFGSPLTLNTSFQNPMFVENAPAFLGMFTFPSWFAACAITFSPWRGIFVLSPVFLLLFLSLIGWSESLRPERRLIIGITLFFFLINISFNGFHAGLSADHAISSRRFPFCAWP
jgi:hypothetical protein